MKLCILIYVAIFASAQQAIPADVDSLATTFDHQRDAQAVQTAEKFFRLLAEDGFTDELVRIIPGSSMDSVRAVTWFWAGEWYYDSQDYDKALSSASKALAFSREAGLRELECDCCNTLSIVWFRKADYSKALEYARETLDIGRELRDESRIAYSLNTLAGICLVSKQAQEGVKYITEAIRICEKQKDSIKLAVRCGMAAEIYHSLGEEDRSLEYARRAYDINIAMGLKDKAAIRLSQMAAAQIALGQTGQAKASLLEALPELERSGNLHSWAISCNQLGDICLQESDSAAAAQYYRNALEVFSSRGDAYNMIHAHLGLSRALKQDAPDEAFEHLMLYSHIKDSLYDSEMNDKLNEYNARYRNDQLSGERDRHLYGKRRILAGGIFATIILALVVWLLQRKNRRTEMELEDMSGKLENAMNRRPSAPRLKLDSDTLVERFRKEIRKQIESDQNVDLQTIAERLCTTRANLNRQIKALTGSSSSAIISEVRIEMAQELLLTERNRSIAEIATLCGIADVSYFIALFKKISGMTPGQWRETNN